MLSLLQEKAFCLCAQDECRGSAQLIYQKNSITGRFCLVDHNGDIETRDYKEVQRNWMFSALSSHFHAIYKAKVYVSLCLLVKNIK